MDTTAAKKINRRLGGSKITRVAPGSYNYKWGFCTYNVRNCGGGWLIFRNWKGSSVEAIGPFDTKREAISHLNVLAYDESMAIYRETAKKIEAMRAESAAR